MAASATDGASQERPFCSSGRGLHGTNVVIALGTNMGNRGLNLHQGLKRLRELGVKVLRHSGLYETAAAYVTDQPAFLNAAVLARSPLAPRELLAVLKGVEAEAGRDLESGQRFGPRPLDLDIVFWGPGQYVDERLHVPHPRWHERPFVMAPVSDLLYRRDVPAAAGGGGGGQSPPAAAVGSGSGSAGSGEASGSGRADGGKAGDLCEPFPFGHPGSVLGHLREVQACWSHATSSSASRGGGGGGGGAGAGGGEVMRRVTPLINLPGPASSSSATSSSASPLSPADALLPWGERTLLMAVLNVTPDSFSDGGAHSGSVAAAVAAAECMVAEGADLIDVGGQSTRPGAPRLSEQEEAGRVVPVIRAMRQSPLLRRVPISVDTFYASVAREAVLAADGCGANIVNDVSGGSLDPDMLRTVADLGVPYVLMHMRGDPGTMTSAEHTRYGSVWRDVGAELMRGAAAAEAAGVAAWSIILDPGIGFAKTAEGNLELIRRLGALRSEALDGPYASSSSSCAGLAGPVLVGPSRKRFLGAVTGREQPADRDAATAAACVACVAGGADVVRVHEMRNNRDALRVADAVYRGPGKMKGPP